MKKTPSQSAQPAGTNAAIMNGDSNRRLNNQISIEELDRMVAESLKDVESDEDVSGDENESALLEELKELTGDATIEKESQGQENAAATQSAATAENVKIIQERIKMYETAAEHAKSANEESRLRRFDRGLKTLNDFLKQSLEGKSVNIDEIPPEVSTKSSNSAEEPENA